VEFVTGDAVNSDAVGTCHGMSLQMFTMQGVLISTQNVHAAKTGLNKTTMDLRRLPNGAYVLQATYGEIVEMRKIIINR
jgi:hypothetical protein